MHFSHDGKQSSIAEHRRDDEPPRVKAEFATPFNAEDEDVVLSTLLHVGQHDRARVDQFFRDFPVGFCGKVFHSWAAPDIFECISRQVDTGGALDFTTMREIVGDQDLRMPKRLAFLYKKGERWVPETYAAAVSRVFRDWRRREMMRSALMLAAAAADSREVGDVAAQFDAAAQDAIKNALAEAPGIFMDDVVKGEVEKLRHFAETGERPVGVRSGLRSVDELVGEFEDGSYVVFAARPGVGKTALADVFARSAEDQGRGVFWVNLEMQDEQLARRRMAAEFVAEGGGAVPYRAWLDRGTVANNLDVFQRLGAYRRNIMIANSSITRVQDILQAVEHIDAVMRRERDVPLGLVVIDYLQILEADEQSAMYRNRAMEVSMMSKAIRHFCRQRKTTTLTLCQLNRDITGRPGLHNLRESGSIEQDCDYALIGRRDEMDHPRPHRGVPRGLLTQEQLGEISAWRGEYGHLEGRAQIQIEKARHGPTGDVEVNADLSTNRFWDGT